MSPNAIGALQEIRVIADLMRKGFAVFKPTNPGHNYDLLVEMNGNYYSFEVRTAYETVSKKLVYRKEKVNAQYLALGLPDRIIYVPDIIEKG